MKTLFDSLYEVLSSVDRLRRTLSRKATKQVSANEEKSLVKATCLAWFNTHRPRLKTLHNEALLQTIDRSFQNMLECSDRSTSRSRYKAEFKVLRSNLVRLRSQAAILGDSVTDNSANSVSCPDFPKLIADKRMQAILVRRWSETQKCLDAGAYLAATVIMGSLLEALLLARVNKLSDKTPVFNSNKAPKNPKTGKVRPLQEWTLNSFIDVAHELGWIRRSARDVGVVLRDYRNFIHPEKEFRHGISVDEDDANMFWVIFTQLSGQIIGSQVGRCDESHQLLTEQDRAGL